MKKIPLKNDNIHQIEISLSAQHNTHNVFIDKELGVCVGRGRLDATLSSKNWSWLGNNDLKLLFPQAKILTQSAKAIGDTNIQGPGADVIRKFYIGVIMLLWN